MTVTGNQPVSASNVAAAIGAAPASTATDGKPVSAANLKAMVDAQAAERSKTARLQDMTWAQLKEISDATNAGNLEQMKEKYKHLLWQRKDVHVKYPNGSEFDAVGACIDMGKDVDENGKPVLFTFAIIYELLHSRYNSTSTKAGWDKSELRTNLNGNETSYYSELTPYVTPVLKKNTPEYSADTVDKYWIPSATEMCVPVNSGDYTDKVALGKPYSWFENYRAKSPKNFDLYSGDTGILTRSSYSWYSCIIISSDGRYTNYAQSSTNFPSILCFCI